MSEASTSAAPFRSPDEPSPFEVVFAADAKGTRNRDIAFGLGGVLGGVLATLQLVGYAQTQRWCFAAALPDVTSGDSGDPILTVAACAVFVIAWVIGVQRIAALALPAATVESPLAVLRSRNRFTDRGGHDYWYWDIRTERGRWSLATSEAPDLARHVRAGDRVRVTYRRGSRTVTKIERAPDAPRSLRGRG